MINVTNSIEKAYEESTTQYDKIVLNGQEYDINNVEYEDDCYLDGNIFGTAIARTLDFEIENLIDLENKEFKYLTGIKTENGIEWIDLGTFITQEIEFNDTTGTTKVTAMDYMLKSNIEYVSNLDYKSGTVTILQVLQEACKKAGITLATTNFANAGFIVDSNQFTEGSLIRQVFQAVAQISGTFAKVRYDDKLYFITPKRQGLKVQDIHKMLVKDLDRLHVSKLAGCKFKMKMNDYSELILKRNTHPINLVSLGMSNIEGENVVMRDEESIAEIGENSLIINDNPFAYTESKRQQLIIALFRTVKGFEYTSYEITGQSKPYQEIGDEVVVIDNDGTYSYSFLFRFNYKSPNGLESEMSAPSLTKATVNYQNVASSEEQAIKRTELIVDKQNQTITGLITKTDGNTKKISEHTQTINEITDTLKSVTTTVSKTVKEVKVMYALSDSSTQAPTSGWSVEAPEWQKGKYMWQKTVTTFSDDTQEESQPTCIQGAKGQDGKDGANGEDGKDGVNGQDGKDGKDGLGIKSIETQYYLSTSETELTGGTWKSTQDKWSKGKYIWTRSKITWSDNTVTYSTAVVAEGLNTANENADSANEGTKEVTTKMSEVEKTVEGITQTVNKTTERLNNDYSTTEQMNSVIEQKAGSITSSVTETIENIQVGGTNLIPNSAPYNLENWYISNKTNIELTLTDESTAPYSKCLRIRTLAQPSIACGIYIIPTSKVLEQGKEYCFSIWLKATAATNVTVGYARGGQTTFNVTTEWKKFTHKFKALAPTGNSHGFIINVPAGTTAGRSVYVHSIKLEEGNKITAWSPAPTDDVKSSEIGTKIEQNAKSVRVAWNNFSQFIQMQILNGNASLVIKDDNNNILMSLDKTGQHFYNNNNQIANIGLSEKENTKYVSFGVNGESGKATNAGFAWGINMKEGGFLPIFWMDSYYYVANSGVMTGKFTIAGILDVIGKMGVNGGFYLNGDIGVFFIEGENERRYFEIYSTDIEDNSGFAFFDGYGNSYFQGYKRDGQDVYFMNFNNNDAIAIRNCRAQEFINESKKEIKDKIKKANNNAIEIVKNSNIYEYELKSENENKKHYGFVIDEEKNDVPEQILSTNKEGINLYSLGAINWKATQELNEKVENMQSTIEQLQNKVNELEKLIEKEA